MVVLSLYIMPGKCADILPNLRHYSWFFLSAYSGIVQNFFLLFPYDGIVCIAMKVTLYYSCTNKHKALQYKNTYFGLFLAEYSLENVMSISIQALMYQITPLTLFAPVSQTTLYEFLQTMRDNRAILSNYNDSSRQVNHRKRQLTQVWSDWWRIYTDTHRFLWHSDMHFLACFWCGSSRRRLFDMFPHSSPTRVFVLEPCCMS